MSASRCRMMMAVVVAAVLASMQVDSVVAVAECCSTCIGKTAESPYDYDPLVYEQCKLKPSGNRVCCFECGDLGEPEYGDAITYGEDGTTAQVKAGTWISVKWAKSTKVTYVSLKDGQKKTTTPTVNGSEATVSSGFYMICAKAKGSIVFRGWGADTCRAASLEKTVKIIEGDAGATCEASAPTLPTQVVSASSGSGENDLTNCNMNRATIKVVDGKKQCVCVSDWAGAPACDQMPAWKWLITIGGGLAALFSIVISVRAFMNSREKKRQQEQDALDTPYLGGNNKDDVEILQIGADRASPSKHTAYKRRDDEDRNIYKMNDRPYDQTYDRTNSRPHDRTTQEFSL